MRISATFLVIIFLFLSVKDVTAQLPDLIPPSPEAAALGKFVEHPVSLYNGIPNISVPLYTIKGKDITFPIDLHYNSSGIKVEEDASWAGLGWAVSNTGVITRMINGVDDFALNEPGWFANSTGYLYSPEANYSTDLEYHYYLRDLCQQKIDSRPDIFYYNFHGHSGKFILKKKINSYDPVRAVVLSNEKISIAYDESARTWTFLTNDGNKYIFGTKEEGQTWTGTGTSYEEVFRTSVFPDQYYNKKTISAWYLDKIISPWGEEFIFTYRDGVYTSEVYSFSELRSMPINFSSPQNSCPGIALNQSATRTGTFLKYLSSIQVRKNGIASQGYNVTFYSSDREDIKPYDNKINPVFGKAQKLDRIIVQHVENYIPKKILEINLQTSYWETGTGSQHPSFGKRLKLDQVKFLDATGSLSYRYTFFYNSTSLPVKNSNAVDFWGYYNGQQNTGNPVEGQLPTKIPAFRVMNNTDRIDLYGANRYPDSSTSNPKACVLEKIVYPTGGYTEYDYELNEFHDNNYQPQKSMTFSASGNQSTQFEIKMPTMVTLVADLHYLKMRCYPDANNQQISYTSVPSQQFAASIRYAAVSNSQFFSIGYLHYKDCLLTGGPEAVCSGIELLGHESARCGVRRKVSMVLNPGTYLLETNSLPDWTGSIVATFDQDVSLDEDVTAFKQKGGGLRIKEIRTFESATSQPLISRYDYSQRVKKVRIPVEAAGNESQVFRITTPTNVNIVAQIISENPLNPQFGNEVLPGLPYAVTLRNFADYDNPQVSLTYEDYGNCIVSGTPRSSCYGIERLGPVDIPNGIRKKTQIMLQPGLYILEAISRPYWKASISTDFNRTHLVPDSAAGDLTISSGKVMSYPRFHYQDEVKAMTSISGYVNLTATWSCFNLYSTSYSNRPMSNSAQGSSVGYDRVTEYKISPAGNTGKSVYYFINQPDTPFPSAYYHPGAPTNSFDFKNGLLTGKEVFDSDDKLIQLVRNSYTLYNAYWSRYFFSRNTGPCDSSNPVCFVPAGSIGSIVQTCIGVVPTFFALDYVISYEFWPLTKTTESSYHYDGSNPFVLTKETTFHYNANHKLRISESVLNSDGQQISTETKYPLDISTSSIFQASHIHNKPLEIVHIVAGQQIGGSQFVYTIHADKGNRILLDAILDYNTSLGAYETRYEFKYDGIGNVIEVSDYGYKTAYIWGYNSQYLVAKIDGFSRVQVDAALGSNFNGGANGLEGAELSSLYSSFPRGALSVYDYNLGTGLASVRDANQQLTSFEYDALGRLSYIKDTNGNVLKAFQYHFYESNE